MLRVIHSIDRGKVQGVFFGTLTVPRGEGSWSIIERQRRAWLKRFEREYADRAFIVWKKETHKSGTVHLHALIHWLREIPLLKDFREWNDNAWADVVKSKNPHHRRCGCRVEKMHSWNGVGYYGAKYLAKDQDGLQVETGRIWGVHNRHLLPACIDVQHVPRPVGIRARRVLRKLQQRRREKWFIKIGGDLERVRPGVAGSVLDQITLAKLAGLKVKRSRPRCMSTINVKIWASDVDSGKFETHGEEKHTYSPALHFVREDEARRVLMWSMARWLDDLDEESGNQIPF